MNTNKIWIRLLMASVLLALLSTTACGMEIAKVNAIEGPAEQALAEQGHAHHDLPEGWRFPGSL